MSGNVALVTNKGSWNALTNAPAISNSTQNNSAGDYYTTSVAGTSSFTSRGKGQYFAVGDIIVYNGAVWTKNDQFSVESGFGTPANWKAAYDDHIISGSFANNTITLNQKDGGSFTIDLTGVGGSSVLYRNTFEVTNGSGQNSFTLSTAIDHEDKTQVFIDGVYQQKTGYSVSGTTLTFDNSVVVPQGSTVEIISFSSVALTESLANAKIFVGDSNANAIARTVSGDATLANTGALTLNTVPIAKGGTGATSASAARTSLGLGSVATTASTDYATSAQGTKADTAHGWGDHGSGGYITGITSGSVTTALGFTPYNATNPSSFITGITFANVSSKPTTLSGYGITNAAPIASPSFTGNVGISTTSPLSKLHVASGSDAAANLTLLTLENGSTAGADITTPNTFIDFVFTDDNSNVTPQARIGAHAGDGGDAASQILEGRGYLTFHTSNTDEDTGVESPPERLRITSGGDLNIPTTSQKIVMGSSDSTNNMRVSYDGLYSYGTRDMFFNVVGNRDMYFKTNNTTRLTVLSTGVVKIQNTGAAHLILNGDTNNVDDTGQEDAIIDLLGDGDGSFGYRMNMENHGGATALHFQEKINSAYTSRLKIQNDGRVGIGNSSPTVSQSGYGMEIGDNSTNAGIRLNAGSGGWGYTEYYQGTTARFIAGYRQIDNSFRIRSGNSLVGGNGLDISSDGVTTFTKPWGSNLPVLKAGNTANSIASTIYDTAIIQADDVTSIRIRERNPSTTDQEMGLSVGDNNASITSTKNIRFYTGATAGATIYNGQGGVLALTISSGGAATFSGDVGIGTTSPATELQIGDYTDAAQAITIATTQNGTGRINFYDNNDTEGGIIKVTGKSGGSTMTFAGRWNVDNPKVVFDLATGDVGIGTTSPSAKLHVVGKGLFTDDIQLTQTSPRIDYGNSTAGALRFWSVDENSEKMRITSAGAIGIGTTSPLSKLHVASGAAPADDLTLLTLENGNSTGDISTPNTFIDFVFKDSNDNVTPQARIGAHAGDGGDANAVVLEGKGYLTFHTSDTGGSSGVQAPPERVRIASNGRVGIGITSPTSTLHVVGTVNVTSTKNFYIDHPLESKKDTHSLIHASVESPEVNNLYRGKVDLVNGTATVNLDTVSSMTEGTFVALNNNAQCFTTNESDWDAVKGGVVGNELTISCQNSSSTANVSWMVISNRKDISIMESSGTDSNGKLIVEEVKIETP